MNRYAIRDASYYPSKQLGVAAQMLAQAMGNLVDDDASVTMVSCTHPQECGVVERIAARGPVVVGGPGALSPGAFEAAQGVVLGDYQAFVSVVKARGLDAAMELENVFQPKNPRSTSIDMGFPWECSGKFQGEDGKTKVFLSRGCKNKCAFCQTGWALDCSENPDDLVIARSNPKACNYVTNDLSRTRFFRTASIDVPASHTLREVARSQATGKMFRFGIEGVSERLRRAVGKPISNQLLLDETVRLCDSGACVRWFMIAGLPGESDSDYEELRECVRAFSLESKKGALQISFTAYCPEPSTPIAKMEYDDAYYDRYETFARWYFGVARINRVAVFRCQAPKKRNEKAAYSMRPANAYVKYPHRNLIEKAAALYARHAKINPQRGAT